MRHSSDLVVSVAWDGGCLRTPPVRRDVFVKYPRVQVFPNYFNLPFQQEEHKLVVRLGILAVQRVSALRINSIMSLEA